jgi:hypothetical protein
MCGNKLGIRAALMGLFAVTASTTATLQAQEIKNHQLSIFTTMPTFCIDVPGVATCLASWNNILGITRDAPALRHKRLQSDFLSQVDIADTAPLFTLQDRPCEKWQYSPKSSLNTDYPDPISLTRHLTVDFEMDEINRFELSSLYLGFRDCW